MVRHARFASVSILTLSLAIAANTSLYAVLDALLYPKSSVKDPARLVTLEYRERATLVTRPGLAEVLEQRALSFADVSGFTPGAPQIATNERNYREVRTATVPLNFFTVLGVSEVDGRLFGPADHSAPALVAVITRSLERALFPRDQSAIGSSIVLGGSSVSIIGVIANGVPAATDMWLLMPRVGEPVTTIARLKENVSVQQARSEMSSVQQYLARERGITEPSFISLQSITAISSRIQSFHIAVTLGVLAVLLIASINVAALQLARGLERSSEFATRAAMGATRADVIRLVLKETVTLSIPAICLGILISLWAIEYALSVVPPNLATETVEPSWSWRVLLVSVAIPTVLTAVTSLIPGLTLSRLDPGQLLRGNVGTGVQIGRWYGNGLVVIQVGLAVSLSIAFIVLMRSGLRLGFQSRGIDTSPLVYANLSESSSRTQPRSVIAAQLVQRLKYRPEVIDAAAIVLSWVPEDGTFVISNRGRDINVYAPSVNFHLVTPTYLRTLGIDIHRGRHFHDNGEARPVGIINETAASLWWQSTDPLGSVVKPMASGKNGIEIEIIGIAKDVQMDPMSETIPPMLVFVHSRDTSGLRGDSQDFEVMLRSSNPARTVVELRHAAGRHQAWVETWDQLKGIDRLKLRHRFFAALFAGLAAIAIGMVALGIYSLMHQRVTQSVREHGIRLALGAQPRTIMFVILREAYVLGLAGVALGLFTSQWSIGLLRSHLFGLEPLDPLLFSVAGVGVLCVVVLSSVIPALRILAIDPSRAIYST